MTELPAVLVDPPWRLQRKRPIPPEGARLPTFARDEATIRFAPFEREALLARARSVAPLCAQHLHLQVGTTPDAAATGAAAIHAAVAHITKNPFGRERICMRALVLMEDEQAALEFLENVVSPKMWCDERLLVGSVFAKLGARAAFALLRVGRIPEYRDTIFKSVLPSMGTPWAVPLVLDAFVRLRSFGPRARKWLRKWVDEALPVLVPFSVGISLESLGLTDVIPQAPERLEPAHAALALGYLVLSGEIEKIRCVADAQGIKGACERVLKASSLEGKTILKPKSKSASLTPPLSLPEPPNLLDGGEPLPESCVSALIELFQLTNWELPPSELNAVSRALEPTARARFVNALFEGWISRGTPRHETWIAHACAQLGDARSIALLIEAAQTWSHTYQVTSAEPLKALATMAIVVEDERRDMALGRLGALALKARSRSQERIAGELLKEIAEALELPIETLDDRFLPTFGLDERDGTMALDYGTGSGMRARIDAHLQPYVIDEDGARLDEPPAPNRKDDPEKTKQAIAKWKRLKKELRFASHGIVRRIETWLRERHTWHVSDFRAHMLRHPIWRQVCSGLVWGVYVDGGITHPLRIAEDGTFADLDDAPFFPAQADNIGLLHPAEISESLLAKWGQVFGDYEIMQPIAQLAWPTVRITAEERAALILKRYVGRSLDPSRPADDRSRLHPSSSTTPIATRFGRSPTHTTIERLIDPGLRLFVVLDRSFDATSRHSFTIVDVGLQRLEAMTWAERVCFGEANAASLSEGLQDLETMTTPTT